MIRAIAWFVIALCLIAHGPVFADERQESFDRDPQWEGRNNRSQAIDPRPVVQDFGYCLTNHARGAAPGEIGGLITPAGEPACYGQVLPPKTFGDRLSATGTFLAAGRQFHILVGFYHSDTLNEWRTPNTIALRLYGRGDVFYAYVEYATAKWRAGGDDPRPFASVDRSTGGSQRNPLEFARNVPHRWTLEYDPQANGGSGVITASIDESRAVCELAPGHRADGGAFNRFGIMTVMKQVDSGGEVWLDDLTINGESESFDRDPKWEGRNNRRSYVSENVRPRFNFGYQTTHFAGGRRAGEIGGLVFRGDCRNANRLACYGDRLETLTLERPLRAAGRISLRRGVSDSTTLFGFYHSEKSLRVNESQSQGLPANFLGIAIEGPSREGFFLYPAYRLASGESGWADGDQRPRILPNGESHPWTLDYSPTAHDGRGAITVRMAGETAELVLPAVHRPDPTEFNRFGFVTTWIDGNGQHVYFDDVEYSWRQ